MPALLAEVEHVRQCAGEPRRRWFVWDDLDYKGSPVLAADGPLDVRALDRRLEEAGSGLPADVNASVVARRRAHPAYGRSAPAR